MTSSPKEFKPSVTCRRAVTHIMSSPVTLRGAGCAASLLFKMEVPPPAPGCWHSCPLWVWQGLPSPFVSAEGGRGFLPGQEEPWGCWRRDGHTNPNKIKY